MITLFKYQVIFSIGLVLSSAQNRSFEIDFQHNSFLKDGKIFRYISGSIHYFRSPRFYWQDRISKAKALGLNTIQTYVAWNVHEEIQGKFDFDGEKDLIEFIEIAEANDLLVILRPGPYIDAEWEHGGFPWWLAKYNNVDIRVASSKLYMKFVFRWFTVLLEKIKPKLYKNGGPIIALQVENEYGNYYACDKPYLKDLSDFIRSKLGDEIVLFTTDGYIDDYMQCGTLPSLLYATIDFGTEISSVEAFIQQRKFQPHGPLVNSEYYTGWLDYWGIKHETRNGVKIASYLDAILALNASVNLYMFHGGTNFGFMNGADIDKNKFLISPTSYDYDAPLSEAGDITTKYLLIRDVIKKYVPTPLRQIPKNSTKRGYNKVELKSVIGLSDIMTFYPIIIGAPFQSKYPVTMENAGLPYGFAVYETTLPNSLSNTILQVKSVHDRSIVFVDNLQQTVCERGYVYTSIDSGSVLRILVENQGRTAYANKGKHYLPDAKGILSNVTVNNILLSDWRMLALNDTVFSNFQILLERYNFLQDSKRRIREPKLFSAAFTIKEAADTFIDMKNWGKGQVYINNFNVGKYWSVKGPQRTLYVPANVLNEGENRLLIFELDETFCEVMTNCSVNFRDSPLLDINN